MTVDARGANSDPVCTPQQLTEFLVQSMRSTENKADMELKLILKKYKGKCYQNG
jgi:hypothetical protein